jgi:hypothetical protein
VGKRKTLGRATCHIWPTLDPAMWPPRFCKLIMKSARVLAEQSDVIDFASSLLPTPNYTYILITSAIKLDLHTNYFRRQSALWAKWRHWRHPFVLLVSLLFLNSWRVSVVPYYVTILTLQLFKNSTDTQEKLRLNLHSLSVSELLEYRRKSHYTKCPFKADLRHFTPFLPFQGRKNYIRNLVK